MQCRQAGRLFQTVFIEASPGIDPSIQLVALPFGFSHLNIETISSAGKSLDLSSLLDLSPLVIALAPTTPSPEDVARTLLLPSRVLACTFATIRLRLSLLDDVIPPPLGLLKAFNRSATSNDSRLDVPLPLALSKACRNSSPLVPKLSPPSARRVLAKFSKLCGRKKEING